MRNIAFLEHACEQRSPVTCAHEEFHFPMQEFARQSETKRKQALQSEANVCRRRRKCNLKNGNFPY